MSAVSPPAALYQARVRQRTARVSADERVTAIPYRAPMPDA